MIRLQELSLQDTEPNFDLVQPRSIRGQPVDLNAQLPTLALDLLLQPPFQLLGRVRCPVVQNQSQCVNTAPQSLGDHHCQQESLKVDKPFVQTALPIDPPISYAQRSKEIQCSLALIPVRDMYWMPRCSRDGHLFSLASLDRRLLVRTNHPDASLQQRLRLLIQSQNGTSPFQKGLWVQNVLPTVVAPRSEFLRRQPASHRTGCNLHHHLQRHQSSGDFGVAPSRQGHPLFSWSAASQGRRLRLYLRGENAGGLPAAADRQYFSFSPNADATSERYGLYNQPLEQSAGCSTQDGRRQPRESEIASLSRGKPCEISLVFAVFALLRLLTRWNTLVWVRASLHLLTQVYPIGMIRSN